jgi:hypothetical protein
MLEKVTVEYLPLVILILLANVERKQSVSANELAGTFKKLKDGGLEFPGLGLRKIPGMRFYSEDIHDYAFRWRERGWITDSPGGGSRLFMMTTEGEKVFRGMLREELESYWKMKFLTAAMKLGVDPYHYI